MNQDSTVEIQLWSQEAPGAVGSAEHETPSLTFYPAQRRHADEKTACIIVFPGGGYAKLAPHEGEPIALWLNSLGVSAAVLRYRIAPYRHPYPLMDAQRSVRMVGYQANVLGIDPQRIGVLGFSAGGHLAATLGTHYDAGRADASDPVDQMSCRPSLLVLCYPVISLRSFTHAGSVTNLLGSQPNEADLDSLSNELHVTADTPPTFIWHTANDTGVPVENSLMFATSLSKHKVPFSLHVYPEGHHGLGLACNDEYVSTWTDECARFLKYRGFAA